MGYVGANIKQNRGHVSRFAEGIYQQKEKSHNEFLRYSHTTFDNYQSKQIPKQEGRPITLKGGFLNQSVFKGNGSRQQARQHSLSAQNKYYDIQAANERMDHEKKIVKSLKPSKQLSSYKNSFN